MSNLLEPLTKTAEPRGNQSRAWPRVPEEPGRSEPPAISRGKQRALPRASERLVSSDRTRAIYLCVILAWLAAPVLGLVGYFGVVAPTEEDLVSQAVLGLVRDFDAATETRSAALDAITGQLSEEKFRDPEVLDKVLRSVLKRFPDFLSLEVIDREGVIMARVGEFTLSQEGLPTHVNLEKFKVADSADPKRAWLFYDEPNRGSFFMTRQRTGASGEVWFIRARFTRESIEDILNRASQDRQLRAGLVSAPQTDARARAGDPAAGRGGSDYQQPAASGSAVQASREWWSGSVKAKARSQTPGWFVTLQTDRGSSLFAMSPILIPVLLLIQLMLVTLLLRRVLHGYGNVEGYGEAPALAVPLRTTTAEPPAAAAPVSENPAPKPEISQPAAPASVCQSPASELAPEPPVQVAEDHVEEDKNAAAELPKKVACDRGARLEDAGSHRSVSPTTAPAAESVQASPKDEPEQLVSDEEVQGEVPAGMDAILAARISHSSGKEKAPDIRLPDPPPDLPWFEVVSEDQGPSPGLKRLRQSPTTPSAAGSKPRMYRNSQAVELTDGQSQRSAQIHETRQEQRSYRRRDVYAAP